DTDIYISYDEFQQYDKDYSGMKDERDEVNEAGGYYTQPVYDMIKQHGIEKVMHELLTSLDADVIQDFLQRADLDESGLRPSFAKELRNAELNKGKGAPKSGKTTGPDDYDFLKYKNKKKETNEDSSGTLDQDMWDTIKRGDKITIGYDSAIKKDNMQTFVVRSKNVVGKAKVGKITMTTEDGKGKYFLYNRNGKISLALGDMAASMTSAMVESTEMMTEAQFDEAAGEKDACYNKVKSRYKVWPSAYASGALVKCRKVGASNWGNSKK
ncbi:hypothetical protein N8344_00325, partial [bacterium]|nr:hypothetical protein [bacterium]